MSDMNNILQAIPEDDARVADAQRPDRFVASNGIVFKVKAVPPLLIMDVQRKFIPPMPPKLPNFDKGEGSDAPLEENPNDPTYVRELAEHNQRVGEASNAIFLTRGVEVVSIPDGVERLDDAGWAEDIQEFTDIVVPAVGKRRMYCWMKYVALTSMDDFQGLLNKIMTVGGITSEADVVNAEQSFRPSENGDASSGVPPEPEV